MILPISQTLRRHRRAADANPKAKQNPSGAAIAATLAAVAVGGYITWRLVRHAKAAEAPGAGGGGSKLPTGPEEPVGPTEPGESEEWVDYSSPAVSLQMRYSPGIEGRPYEVVYSIDSVGDVGQSVTGNNFFESKEAAQEFIDTAKWYFGRPTAVDDIFVVASGDLPIHDLKIDTNTVRGAVWQDTSKGSFYISIRDPGGIGYLDGAGGAGYAGIDQAIARMNQEIQS